jgi:hypothetical protein
MSMAETSFVHSFWIIRKRSHVLDLVVDTKLNFVSPILESAMRSLSMSRVHRSPDVPPDRDDCDLGHISERLGMHNAICSRPCRGNTRLIRSFPRSQSHCLHLAGFTILWVGFREIVE